ncbi:MAG: hypothetical protein CMO81_08575 [Waddliaceae bacterium]|nr:hypothetical protein [Waddliaceae bacterium]
MLQDLVKVLLVLVCTFALAYGIAYLRLDRKSSTSVVEATKVPGENFYQQDLARDTHLLQGWREYNSTDGGFRVEFPAFPQHVKEYYALADTGLLLEYDVYVVEEEDGTIYMMSLITYPQEIDTSDTTAILHGLKEEMMQSNETNALQSEEQTQYKGVDALNFVIQNQEADINSRALMNDHTLYLLSVIDRKNQFQRDDYMHFVNSFELLETATTETVEAMAE